MDSPDDFENLVSLAYTELRGMARSLMRAQRPGHTLQTTALVHEAYLRLRGGDTSFENRAHFFGAAARAMRQVLIGHARSRNAAKREGEARRVTFRDLAVASHDPDLDLLYVDEALRALEALDSKLCRLIEMRYFGGLTLEEIADLGPESLSTVKRDWSYARAWLFDFLSAKVPANASPPRQEL